MALDVELKKTLNCLGRGLFLFDFRNRLPGELCLLGVEDNFRSRGGEGRVLDPFLILIRVLMMTIEAEKEEDNDEEDDHDDHTIILNPKPMLQLSSLESSRVERRSCNINSYCIIRNQGKKE